MLGCVQSQTHTYIRLKQIYAIASQFLSEAQDFFLYVPLSQPESLKHECTFNEHVRRYDLVTDFTT